MLPLQGRAVEKKVARYARAIDLEHVKTHDFRRSAGTQLARKDIHLAQKAPGHQSILTTERQYALYKLEAGLTDHL
jgi:integrase